MNKSYENKQFKNIDDFFNFVETSSDVPQEDKDYYSNIKLVCEEDFGKEILNGLPAHARVLLTCLFEKAVSSVKILTDTLASNAGGVEVYSWRPLVEEIKNFLERDDKNSLQILHKKDIDKTSDAYKVLQPYINDEKKRVVLRHLPEEKKITYKQKECDFAVADKKIIRMEIDTKIGSASFWIKNEFLASETEEVFDRHFAT